MSTILKPFLLAVTLMLILIRPGFATEDGAITMVKTYSAYDYLQTRARLMPLSPITVWCYLGNLTMPERHRMLT